MKCNTTPFNDFMSMLEMLPKWSFKKKKKKKRWEVRKREILTDAQNKSVVIVGPTVLCIFFFFPQDKCWKALCLTKTKQWEIYILNIPRQSWTGWGWTEWHNTYFLILIYMSMEILHLKWKCSTSDMYRA